MPRGNQPLKKNTSLSLPTAIAALLTATAFAVGLAAQAPQPAAPAGGPPQHFQAPAPTNLKVLPKNLTGEQVHEIMHKWEADLGTNCGHCHTPDPKNIGPNGKPRLNFADDSKKEKATARLMLTMMGGINTDYVGKIDSSGAPVTCGTCHRGHEEPQPYVAPPEHDEHEHHEGPPAGEQKPPTPR
jgi:hypothetical protein